MSDTIELGIVSLTTGEHVHLALTNSNISRALLQALHEILAVGLAGILLNLLLSSLLLLLLTVVFLGIMLLLRIHLATLATLITFVRARSTAATH